MPPVYDVGVCYLNYLIYWVMQILIPRQMSWLCSVTLKLSSWKQKRIVTQIITTQYKNRTGLAHIQLMDLNILECRSVLLSHVRHDTNFHWIRWRLMRFISLAGYWIAAAESNYDLHESQISAPFLYVNVRFHIRKANEKITKVFRTFSSAQFLFFI